VKAANWLSHLEYDHESPIWRHWWRGLAERYHLIRYDERGCGLSDWNPKDFSFAAWVRDLETVVDACAVEKFALLGISQGASVAIDYAVKHPERVSHLILYGGYVKGRAARATNPIEAEEADAYLQMVKVGWGRGNNAFREFFMSMFMPDATETQIRTFVDLQRVTASPENAERFNRIFRDINTMKQAKKVRVPTLVIRAVDDRVVPVAQSRLIASLIPNSRLVLLEGRNHILCEDEPAWQRFLEEVQGFLG
jgi:pimeloyl-ACP methyl ester carboxylesterase